MCANFEMISRTELERAAELVRGRGVSALAAVLATQGGEALADKAPNVGLAELAGEAPDGNPGDLADEALGDHPSDLSDEASDSSPEGLFRSTSGRPAIARPGTIVSVLAVADRHMVIVPMTWGYEAPWKPGKLVFNTRIESAMRDAGMLTGTGEPSGMWGDSLASRRCLVPTRGFYEPDRSRTRVSPRTGRGVRQQVRFSAVLPESAPGAASTPASAAPDHAPASPAAASVLFLACIYQGDRFSVITTEPNASVAPVHDRMPLVLAPAEASAWLGPDFARLADRSALRLVARDV